MAARRSLFTPRTPFSRDIRAHGFLSQQSRNITIAELDEQKRDRQRIVILGAGWGGFVLSRNLDPKKYQTVVVSPRPYFVFTPLLSGTCFGTLEFRNVLEPIRDRKRPFLHYMQAWGDAVDLTNKRVRVEENLADEAQKLKIANARIKLFDEGVRQEISVRKGVKWDVPYDKLVIAVGCYNQTFNTPGVKENAFFLKDAKDARRIRSRILECFEIAALPSTSEEMKKQLLHFAIVGGGPTGMEFSAELSDLVHNDMAKIYPGCRNHVQVSVFDVAPKILSMFDKSMESYAANNFIRRGVKIHTKHTVQELLPGLPERSDGTKIALKDAEGCFTVKTKEHGKQGVGLCVWSTGLAPNPFIANAVNEVRALPVDSVQSITGRPVPVWRLKQHPKSKALRVDNYLRVQLEPAPCEGSRDANVVLKDVFALGDNANVEGLSLPVTAQTANQQARWLSKNLNRRDFGREFTFQNLGIMTYIGSAKALFQGGKNGSPRLTGKAAWLMWRTAYVSMALSSRNKIAIPFCWFITWIFGRDISRF